MALQVPGGLGTIPAKLVADALAAHCPELLGAAPQVAAALAAAGFQPPQRCAQCPGRICTGCDMAMQVCSSKSVDAKVLFVDGWQRVTHTPLRCRSKECRLSGRYVWHNYWSESEAGAEHHFWSWPEGAEM
eukprot:5478470-Pyramimonas_sp.AAC.1